MTALVLAGGRSRRLGTDKASLDWGGRTLLAATVEKMAAISDDVIIVGNVGQAHTYPGTRLVRDVYPGKGSLGGIYSGLLVARDFHSFVVACDMPFLNPGLLSYMAGLASGYDVVIPRLGGHVEPLHAIYSKNCLGPMLGLLQKGDLKIIDFFGQVRIRHVEKGEIQGFDPSGLAFFNINTRADLERAKALSG